MLPLGVALAALRCYTGWRSVSLVGKLCLVVEEKIWLVAHVFYFVRK